MTIFTTGAIDLPSVAERHRNSMTLQSGLGNVHPLHVWDGVHSGMGIVKTEGMGFAITPGRAAVNAPSAADGTLTAVITADEPGIFEPNETAVDRHDMVVLKSYPTNPSQTGVKLEVIKGVPGEQYPPSVPAGSVGLYSVLIRAGMSAANGGWNRAWTVDRRRWIGIPEYTNYTPSFSGFDNSVNSKSAGKYRIDGNYCTVHVRYEGGVGASMGDYNHLSFSLPVPAMGGYVYNGFASLHHPNVSGLAYDLRLLAVGSGAALWKPNEYGALVHPGSVVGGQRYPWGNGTILFARVEYEMEEGWQGIFGGG